jgi:hypothetical protein
MTLIDSEIRRFDKTLLKIAGGSAVFILYLCLIITTIYFELTKKKFGKNSNAMVIMFNIIIPLVGGLIIYYSLKSAYKPEEINDDLNKKFDSYWYVIYVIHLIIFMFFVLLGGSNSNVNFSNLNF